MNFNPLLTELNKIAAQELRVVHVHDYQPYKGKSFQWVAERHPGKMLVRCKGKGRCFNRLQLK